jgi:hypothetical protein
VEESEWERGGREGESSTRGSMPWLRSVPQHQQPQQRVQKLQVACVKSRTHLGVRIAQLAHQPRQTVPHGSRVDHRVLQVGQKKYTATCDGRSCHRHVKCAGETRQQLPLPQRLPRQAVSRVERPELA